MSRTADETNGGNQEMMRLIDYPDAIAQKQRQLLQTEQQIRRLQEALNNITAAIDTTIAFDTTLRNDAQRKARRTEMLRKAEFRNALNNLQLTQDRRTEIEIDLNLLRNQFAVLMLELRESVIQRETHSLDSLYQRAEAA